MRFTQWTRGHIPEIAIFTLGVFLRLTMLWRYKPEWGYDGVGHLDYIAWILQHGSLPPQDGDTRYHPPLYYVVAAGLVKAGLRNVTWLSVTCGVARLGLIWAGLEWYLKDRRARIAGLALAGILPSSIMVDGMVSNEAMSCMFATAAIILLPKAMEATGRRRWLFGVTLGFLFGLALLSKASIFALFAPTGIGLALAALLPFKPIDWRSRLTPLLPWVAGAALCFAISGWFYAQRAREYGSPFVTPYEMFPERLHAAAKTPFLHRRSLGFVVGWDWGIYSMPYYPAGLPHFFPVILASTFTDYYNFSFAGISEGDLTVNGRPLTTRLVWLARGAVLGGNIIFIATLCAWAISLLKTVQRRDWGMFAVLLMPLLATALLLSFATKYPYDAHGPIKAAYIHFGAAPLYAMFGLAAAWGLAKRNRWPVAGLLLIGLAAVAVYTLCCRTGLLL